MAYPHWRHPRTLHKEAMRSLRRARLLDNRRLFEKSRMDRFQGEMSILPREGMVYVAMVGDKAWINYRALQIALQYLRPHDWRERMRAAIEQAHKKAGSQIREVNRVTMQPVNVVLNGYPVSAEDL